MVETIQRKTKLVAENQKQSKEIKFLLKEREERTPKSEEEIISLRGQLQKSQEQLEVAIKMMCL